MGEYLKGNSEFLFYGKLFDITLNTFGNKIKIYLNIIKRLTDKLKFKNITIPDKFIFI